MYKVIGADGKEYGPVTADQLRQWVRENRANGQTLVQVEGSSEMRAMNQCPEFADLFGAPGAPLPVAAPAVFAAEALATRDYQLDIGGSISRGWALVKTNLGLLIGATVLTFLMMGVAGAIPFIGGIIGLVIDGPLLGGLYLVVLGCLRSENVSVGNIFDGFRRSFGQLILGYFIPTLLAAVPVIPGAIPLAIGIVMHAKHNAAALPLLVVGGALLLVGALISIYLSVCWMFTLPLVADKGMDFWSAMKLSRAVVRKHWWAWFGFMFVVGLVAMAGVLACCVGLLFTAPVALAAMMYAYEDVFSRPAASH
jgi:hypothetical protein